MAFERHLVVLPLSNILPMKRVPDSIKQTLRYKRIISSIGEVGIVEPLVVARQQDDNEPYMLVDGHLRHAALMDLGTSEAPCLIADDDEAFTYNKRVNRLATIQEHYMIVKAIERGFPRRNSPGRSMSPSGGSRPSGHCSTGSVPKSPRC
jgi:ParB-like chromosome segregation protein Spo0J